MNFCLLPAASDAFKRGLRDGELDPVVLTNMSSAERNALFAKFVGKENATGVNALFESKLLLKNQQQGMITWAKTVAGMKPEIRRDIISRIEKLNKVLDPTEYDQFLHDLAATKLGVEVTQEEATKISDLSKKVTETRLAMENGGDRLAYGHAKVDLANYVSELKGQAEKIPLKDYWKHPVQVVSNMGGLAKSLKATLDDSALLHQGLPTLFAHPSLWLKNAPQSFVDMVRAFGDKKVMDEVNAEIISRPTYSKMVKGRLAVGNIEEAYPSRLPEKIPIFRRIYNASEVAYSAFLQRTRADIFDKYLKIADNAGVNTNDKAQLESIAKLTNALTGRGHLGKIEPVADVVNNVFFSPRFLKSQFDILTAHQLQKGVTPFVRKQAAYNLLKIIAGIVAILGIARLIRKDSVELDPRSTNFGKIKVGDTTFDVSGGLSGLVVLASRQLSGKSKSSTTGQLTDLSSGAFGQPTRFDVLLNFAEGKLSPAASLLKDLLKGKDFQGNPITIQGELSNLFLPLPVQNYQELSSNPNAANLILGLIADGLGVVTNTKTNSQDLINAVGKYSKDHNVSIEEAQKQLLGDGIITKDSSGHVIFQRMSASEAAAKAKLLGKEGNKQLILDHTVPLELGGSNALSNLKLVPKVQSLADDKIENLLGSAYKNNKISADEARKLIIDYKANKITGQAIYDRLGISAQAKTDKAAAAKATRNAKKAK